MPSLSKLLLRTSFLTFLLHAAVAVVLERGSSEVATAGNLSEVHGHATEQVEEGGRLHHEQEGETHEELEDVDEEDEDDESDDEAADEDEDEGVTPAEAPLLGAKEGRSLLMRREADDASWDKKKKKKKDKKGKKKKGKKNKKKSSKSKAKCGEGYWKSGSRCLECKGSVTRRRRGNKSCTKCPKGNIPVHGSDDCTACGRGTAPKDGKCVECSRGYDSKDGIECKDCSDKAVFYTKKCKGYRVRKHFR